MRFAKRRAAAAAARRIEPNKRRAREAAQWCAQHVRSLGSESLLSNLMEVKD